MGRLLLIDDDEQVLVTLAEVAQALGHTVRTAPDGRRGLDLFEREHFDCVLTDLAMPEVDGLTVLRRVKKKNPNLGVLVITGNSTVELLANAVNLGVDAYVTKPFKIAELDEQITRILAKTRAAAAASSAATAEHPRAIGRAIRTRIPIGWALLAAVLLLIASHFLLG